MILSMKKIKIKIKLKAFFFKEKKKGRNRQEDSFPTRPTIQKRKGRKK
jgi:hypothetical protein